MNVVFQTGDFECVCGRKFTTGASFNGHRAHCKQYLDSVGKSDHESHYTEDSRRRQGWSKGLTKLTSESVRKNAEALKQHYLVNPGKFSGKKHTQSAKDKMAKAARFNATHHLNGWKSGNNRVPNKYEKLVADVLAEYAVQFESEVVVPNGKGYYQLDFLINGKIDLELDGTGHDNSKDGIRDRFISNIYEVYRIKHSDSLDEVREKLLTFILEHCN